MVKKLAIIFAAVFGVLFAAFCLSSWVRPMLLNYALKDGTQLVLEVDTDTMFDNKLEQLYNDVRVELLDQTNGGVQYSNLRNADGVVSFVVRDEAQVADVRNRMKRAFGDTVDLSVEGKKIELTYTEKQRAEMVKDAVSRSIEIVRRRIDALGTKEPSIQSQGGKYILVQLPGVDNPEQIKNLIGQTAKMSFHLVNAGAFGAETAPKGTDILPVKGGFGTLPVYSRVEVSGESLKDSRADFGPDGRPVVTTVFDAAGARKFKKLTTEHVGEQFAIVLDGEILSAPLINEPIPDGRGQISGNFTLNEAQELSVLLRSGALSAPLEVIEERVVGAGL